MTPSYYITAYGLAVKKGFEGTIDDWLASLNGHVHIKYADRLPQCDADMKDEPGDYIGIYADRTEDDSPRYSAYKWHCIKGAANAAVIAPAFVAGHAYSVGDIVSYGDSIYRCVTAGSGTTPAAPKWTQETLGEAIVALGVPYAVAYVAQSLNDSQKTVARSNIGALKDGSGVITDTHMNTNSVGTAAIKPGAVTSEKIGEGEVKTANLDSGAVKTDNIYGGAVTSAKIGTGEVKTANIEDLAVTTGKIAGSAVNGAKLNLANGDLGQIILTSGVHYFESTAQLPAATAGRIAFVKAG